MAPDPASISAAYDALDAAYDTVAALTYDTLDTAATLRCQDRLEPLRRRLPATEHQLLAHAQTQTIPTAIGAENWADVLATRLRISNTEATRRIKEADDLAPAPPSPVAPWCRKSGHQKTGTKTTHPQPDTPGVGLDGPNGGRADLDEHLADVGAGEESVEAVDAGLEALEDGAPVGK